MVYVNHAIAYITAKKNCILTTSVFMNYSMDGNTLLLCICQDSLDVIGSEYGKSFSNYRRWLVCLKMYIEVVRNISSEFTIDASSLLSWFLCYRNRYYSITNILEIQMCLSLSYLPRLVAQHDQHDKKTTQFCNTLSGDVYAMFFYAATQWSWCEMQPVKRFCWHVQIMYWICIGRNLSP